MTRGKDAGFRKKCSCPTSPHWEHPLLFSGNRQILLCACCSSQHSLWFPSPKWISQSPPQVKKEKRFLSLVFLVGMYEIWQGSIQTKERSLRAKASLGLPQQNKFPCKQAKTMFFREHFNLLFVRRYQRAESINHWVERRNAPASHCLCLFTVELILLRKT